MIDRRTPTGDRRGDRPHRRYPFWDRQQRRLVTADRRRTPDRRLQNIQVEWIKEYVLTDVSICRL